jgi:hypothetical protein
MQLQEPISGRTATSNAPLAEILIMLEQGVEKWEVGGENLSAGRSRVKGRHTQTHTHIHTQGMMQ